MVFNGHTEEYIDSIDEELFTDIQVMYSDGLLGNKGIFEALTPLTSAVFNYMRPAGAASYKPEQIFPWVTEYSTNPDNDATAGDGLFGFMTQAKEFRMERFKNAGNSKG